MLYRKRLLGVLIDATEHAFLAGLDVAAHIAGWSIAIAKHFAPRTVVHKVEIVISSNLDPERIARLTSERLNAMGKSDVPS